MNFTGTDAAQIITALGAIGAMVTSLRNKQAIKEVHLTMNSRLDELLTAVGIAKIAEGRKLEREEAEREKNPK